ncbi:MAG: LDH2 family malate/lactate/ureidoglycolate dehydrogenase [Parasphingorhabdus sp.]|jgi:LDH2 family malate/lactate/ureidoglycolate dehydrogenase
MKVSKNELMASLKKAFEGLGFHPGDYYDAADMVVWLETHGLDGFDRLQAALAYLNTTGPTHAELIEEGTNYLFLDGNDSSILLCGSEAIDLLSAQIMEGSAARLQLNNCYNRTFILQRLVKAAQRNLAFIAYWRQDDCCIKVSIAAGADLPEHQTFSMAEDIDPQSLTVFAGTDLVVVEQQFSEQIAIGELIETYSSAGMSICYQDSVEQGIEIDEVLWSTLEGLVERILVESTESSRAGAGD